MGIDLSVKYGGSTYTINLASENDKNHLVKLLKNLKDAEPDKVVDFLSALQGEENVTKEKIDTAYNKFFGLAPTPKKLPDNYNLPQSQNDLFSLIPEPKIHLGEEGSVGTFEIGVSSGSSTEWSTTIGNKKYTLTLRFDPNDSSANYTAVSLAIGELTSPEQKEQFISILQTKSNAGTLITKQIIDKTVSEVSGQKYTVGR